MGSDAVKIYEFRNLTLKEVFLSSSRSPLKNPPEPCAHWDKQKHDIVVAEIAGSVSDEYVEPYMRNYLKVLASQGWKPVYR